MSDAMPTRGQVASVADPLGWRLILGALITHVEVPSLTVAVQAAVTAVEVVGEEGDGHLSVDLHADRVVLYLHTLAAGRVTAHDLSLAPRITAALAARSLVTRAGDGAVGPQAIEIAIDALDIPAVRPFWQAVTGYVDVPALAEQLPDGALCDPLRRGPTIWFQQMDAPRRQRNRIHIDVDVAPELAQPRIEAALAAGGTLLSADAAPAFWVLADPEGNEVCVCTWQGRD